MAKKLSPYVLDTIAENDITNLGDGNHTKVAHTLKLFNSVDEMAAKGVKHIAIEGNMALAAFIKIATGEFAKTTPGSSERTRSLEEIKGGARAFAIPDQIETGEMKDQYAAGLVKMLEDAHGRGIQVHGYKIDDTPEENAAHAAEVAKLEGKVVHFMGLGHSATGNDVDEGFKRAGKKTATIFMLPTADYNNPVTQKKFAAFVKGERGDTQEGIDVDDLDISGPLSDPGIHAKLAPYITIGAQPSPPKPVEEILPAKEKLSDFIEHTIQRSDFTNLAYLSGSQVGLFTQIANSTEEMSLRGARHIMLDGTDSKFLADYVKIANGYLDIDDPTVRDVGLRSMQRLAKDIAPANITDPAERIKYGEAVTNMIINARKDGIEVHVSGDVGKDGKANPDFLYKLNQLKDDGGVVLAMDARHFQGKNDLDEVQGYLPDLLGRGNAVVNTIVMSPHPSKGGNNFRKDFWDAVRGKDAPQAIDIDNTNISGRLYKLDVAADLAKLGL